MQRQETKSKNVIISCDYKRELAIMPKDIQLLDLENAFKTKNYVQATNIISKGFDVNSLCSAGKKSLLLWAIEQGDARAVHILLVYGANVNAINAASIYSTLVTNQFDIADSLICYNADINSTIDGQPLLIRALNEGQINAAKFLIKNKADIFVRDEKSHNTCLHYAIRLHDLDLFSLLIRSGADELIRKNNKSGVTPIELAKSLSTRFPNDKGYKSIYVILCRYNARPHVGVIERYDEEKGIFSLKEREFKEKTFESKKNIAVLFNAKSDHNGSILMQYYNNFKYINILSKDFIIFRINVETSQQIPYILKLISNKYMGAHQKIQHMMINGHANNNYMKLGDIGKYSLLHDDDLLSNNSAMTEACKLLGPNATISLFGCSTAADEKNNLAKKLSASEIAGGRMVFGALNPITADRFFKTITYVENQKEERVPLPIFQGLDKNTIAAYKNEEEILRGEWEVRTVPRSKL